MPERYDHPIVGTTDEVADQQSRRLIARAYGREANSSRSKAKPSAGARLSVVLKLIRVTVTTLSLS